MRLLDLFCGAGGCAVGYARAGFTDIVGVDIKPQPRYPFAFVQADALEVLTLLVRGCGITGRALTLNDFDAIHASPPCQRYTVARTIHASGDRHPDLVEPCRELLDASGLPWVMENVVGSPLVNPVTLCGLAFGLRVIRHRLFESSIMLMVPPHKPHPKHLTTGTVTAKRGGRGNGYSTGESGLVCVAGNNFVKAAGATAMGIDWMTDRKELANAIPPGLHGVHRPATARPPGTPGEMPVSGLHRFHRDLDSLMQDIAAHFKPGARLTLVVRNPGVPGDTGVLLTDDDLGAVIAEIEKRKNPSVGCPRCMGSGRYGTLASALGVGEEKPCAVCNGTGVVG